MKALVCPGKAGIPVRRCSSACQVIASAILLGLLTELRDAGAATTTWTNTVNSYWTNTPSWNSGVPGAGDTANWTSTSGSVKTNRINITETQTITTLTMDWAGASFTDAGTLVYLNGGSGAKLNMSNLQMAYGDGGGGGYTALSDTIGFSNLIFSVGSSSARGVIQMGRKTGGNNYGIYGTLTAYSNASFSAYLTSLNLGYGGHSSGAGLADVNLAQATSVVINVSGNIELGSSSTAESNFRSGTLTINNGVAQAANLYVGYTTAAETQTGYTPYMRGYLTLTNTSLAVLTGGKVYMGGRGTNSGAAWQYNEARITVSSRASGGLDIQDSATTGLNFKFPTLLNNDGTTHYVYNQINVILIEPSAMGWSWGLRWTGNHTNSNTQGYNGGGAQGLRALLDSQDQYARLRVITNGLSRTTLANHLSYIKSLEPVKYASTTLSDLTQSDFIIYDNGYTYVGLYNSSIDTFVETFENRYPTFLDGQNSWVGNPPAGSFVHRSAVYTGLQAGAVCPDAVLTRSIPGGQGVTNVWVDFYAKPVAGETDPSTSGVSSCAAFYLSTNGYMRALSNNTWVTLGNYAVSTGRWYRFSVNLNYPTSEWSLFAADSTPNRLSTTLATNLAFSGSATNTYFNSFEVRAPWFIVR